MKKFRLTPARRDFFRTVIENNGVVIHRTNKRFFEYRMTGQLTARISALQFDAYIAHGYLVLTESNDGIERYEATEKAINTVGGK